jgi:hypothetical protein
VLALALIAAITIMVFVVSPFAAHQHHGGSPGTGRTPAASTKTAHTTS